MSRQSCGEPDAVLSVEVGSHLVDAVVEFDSACDTKMPVERDSAKAWAVGYTQDSQHMVCLVVMEATLCLEGSIRTGTLRNGNSARDEDRRQPFACSSASPTGTEAIRKLA